MSGGAREAGTEAKTEELSGAVLRFLGSARVGHLATASASAVPHVVPVCFAVVDPRTITFAIDEKPKPVARPLKRIRNLGENPRFALTVDRWDEDWSRLGYVMIFGTAAPCADPARAAAAVRRLRERYPQYVSMGLAAGKHAVLELRVERIHSWGAID
jgi:PPOX class probable F420-dependent enzyme